MGLGAIISCPASYHDLIGPNKANLVQDHGYSIHSQVSIKIFAIFFTLRVKTSPIEK